MPWTMNSNIIGNQTCTQFLNTGADQLLPTTAYQTSPFINSNTTQSQTITFTQFSTLTKTDSVNTATLSASASSTLSVSFTSLDTNIATVSGTTLVAHTAGTVVLQANQTGNATYDPATPAYCYFTISLYNTYTGPNTYIQNPSTIQVTSAKNYLNSYTITVDDCRYTQYTGISYGYGTGFHGAVLVGNVSGYDSSSAPITNYSDAPISVSFNIPHANTNHSYSVYKRNGTSLIDPQPAGYPVALTYSAGEWTGLMSSLSDIVVIDSNPPSGIAGGDPYIMSVKRVKTLLPNTWKRVRLFETIDMTVVANCDFLQNSVVAGLHYINKARKECMAIDPTKHKWTTDITYVVSIEFIHKYNKEKKLVVDTLTGSIMSDSSKLLYEKIKSDNKGLYSITHNGYYPPVNTNKFLIHFKEGYMVVTIDNFWDDINFIELFLNETNYNLYTGELIEHSESNLLESTLEVLDVDSKDAAECVDSDDYKQSSTESRLDSEDPLESVIEYTPNIVNEYAFELVDMETD
jgi:hypothetical protein